MELEVWYTAVRGWKDEYFKGIGFMFWVSRIGLRLVGTNLERGLIIDIGMEGLGPYGRLEVGTNFCVPVATERDCDDEYTGYIRVGV